MVNKKKNKKGGKENKNCCSTLLTHAVERFIVEKGVGLL